MSSVKKANCVIPSLVSFFFFFNLRLVRKYHFLYTVSWDTLTASILYLRWSCRRQTNQSVSDFWCHLLLNAKYLGQLHCD